MSQSPSDGPGGVPSWDVFSGDGPGCGPPPGAGLAALLGEAIDAIDELGERQALGASTAARRLRAHADYIEIMMVARFGRIRAAQLEASKARGDRVRSRDGEYPAEELGFEMTASARSAGLLLDMAANIADRLPNTLAGMAAGVIDRDRARLISNATDGHAIAHACAPGTHPWTPPPTSRDGPARREDRYTPSRKLKHLVRARTARCAAPGCGAQAITSDIDHTTPYPAGPSCQCNLGPACQL